MGQYWSQKLDQDATLQLCGWSPGKHTAHPVQTQQHGDVSALKLRLAARKLLSENSERKKTVVKTAAVFALTGRRVRRVGPTSQVCWCHFPMA